jgi:uracil-DNA glycosylase
MQDLLRTIKQCTLCARHLPLGPRPVFSASPNSRILIIGQAPGTKVHASGIPWDDASGRNLRQWMNITPEDFYDENKIAIIPMGFCYPGKGKSCDLPPRPECADKWHKSLLDLMPNIQLTLLIGQYAQNYYLKERKKTLTETVKNFKAYLPHYIALPHPSPRNNIWMKKNPWFKEAVIPTLQTSVSDLLRS